jgi:gliding motility-associated-like protein
MNYLNILIALLLSSVVVAQNNSQNDNIVNYRVVAYENTNNTIVSVSNTVQSVKRLHIQVPNAFSPDGDGINDFFTAVSDGVEDYSIEIYNRWGELVFQSDDINHYWDGTYKGKKSMQDAYVYVIRAKGLEDNQPTVLKGTVSLIR